MLPTLFSSVFATNYVEDFDEIDTRDNITESVNPNPSFYVGSSSESTIEAIQPKRSSSTYNVKEELSKGLIQRSDTPTISDNSTLTPPSFKHSKPDNTLEYYLNSADLLNPTDDAAVYYIDKRHCSVDTLGVSTLKNYLISDYNNKKIRENNIKTNSLIVLYQVLENIFKNSCDDLLPEESQRKNLNSNVNQYLNTNQTCLREIKQQVDEFDERVKENYCSLINEIIKIYDKVTTEEILTINKEVGNINTRTIGDLRNNFAKVIKGNYTQVVNMINITVKDSLVHISDAKHEVYKQIEEIISKLIQSKTNLKDIKMQNPEMLNPSIESNMKEFTGFSLTNYNNLKEEISREYLFERSTKEDRIGSIIKRYDIELEEKIRTLINQNKAEKNKLKTNFILTAQTKLTNYVSELIKEVSSASENKKKVEAQMNKKYNEFKAVQFNKLERLFD